jgi:hypothetical protein
MAACEYRAVKSITSVEVRGRVGPGTVEKLLVTFEQARG